MRRNRSKDFETTYDLVIKLPNASSILLRNVYGWFTRIERGVYALTPEGASALARWPQTDMAAVTSAGSRIHHRQHSAVPG